MRLKRYWSPAKLALERRWRVARESFPRTTQLASVPSLDRQEPFEGLLKHRSASGHIARRGSSPAANQHLACHEPNCAPIAIVPFGQAPSASEQLEPPTEQPPAFTQVAMRRGCAPLGC